jgi:acylphosphatase
MTQRLVRHVIIRGHVQGVGYRAWTEDQALLNGLEGWVRNRRDGTVEAVFAGPPETVQAMIAACRQGPLGSRVEAIDVNEPEGDAIAAIRPGERFSVLLTK